MGKRETWREWIVMVTQAIQLSLVLLALLLSAWLGESSPSWRQMPSITHIQTECVLPVCGGWQCGSVRLNARHHCPLCSFLMIFSSPFRVPRLPPGVCDQLLSNLSKLGDLPRPLPSAISTLPSLSSRDSYFYSCVLQKQEQIRFCAHQHFQGPTAEDWEGKRCNPITHLDTRWITASDWHRL